MKLSDDELTNWFESNTIIYDKEFNEVMNEERNTTTKRGDE